MSILDQQTANLNDKMQELDGCYEDALTFLSQQEEDELK